MKPDNLKSNLLLLLAAAIWGFAFVAQRVGMDYIGAFTYNGVRFALGSLSLVPLILYFRKKNTAGGQMAPSFKRSFQAGLLTGLILFAGASFQQLGIIETSAGKAAFITGLYIVLVPILGLFVRHRIGINAWAGAVAAAAGLYLLSVTEQLTISRGDALELAGAFFWTLHILLIDHFSRRVDVLQLSFSQCITCSVLSLGVALFTEDIALSGLLQAAVPILYGGICSVGIAYTLQIVGQKNAQPTHAAIILSLEAVFASIGGFLILNENLGPRGYAGCMLMLAGMLLSQIPVFKHKKNLHMAGAGRSG